jgi:prepilin-type N-terminal cleavage/methylation domain-containing protein
MSLHTSYAARAIRTTQYAIRINNKPSKGKFMKKARAFTLIEVLAVTVLLGVIAAIVIPAVANSGTAAKESALATDLQLLRRFILVYKAQHLEIGPGYPDGNTSAAPTEQAFIDHATRASKTTGETADPGTPDFNRGPYLSKIPVNPFNNKDTVQMLADGEDFPADADDSHGWIYKAATSQIRPDNTGSDSSGKRYYDY